MENDVLKNRIAPWQEKGRWYHGLWDYATSSFDSTETDSILLDSNLFEITFDGSVQLIYPKLLPDGKKYTIIDLKYKARNNVTVSSNVTSYIGAIRTTSSGATGRAFARHGGITGGKADIWFFMDFVKA